LTVAKGWFTVLVLEDFAGGNLTVNAQYGVMFMSNMIKPKGAGHLVMTARFRGPKEWSPHGVVPKEWVEVLRLSDACNEISTAYKTRGGAVAVRSFPITPREKQTIYFVKGQPGRIPGPP